jgi:nicotinamide riboside kinase
MRIAISGTYSTGKTTLSLALSYLTGIPATRARTMREILPDAFPGYSLEQCGASELMELGMRRFSERVRTEMQRGNSFISDGCSLQEWLYGSTRLKTGFNPAEKPAQVKRWIKKHPKEWQIFRETIESFGMIVKAYARDRYDTVIHLPVEFPLVADGHRPASETFRAASEQLLINTCHELGFHPVEVQGSIHKRLNTIVEKLKLDTVRDTEESIRLAEEYKKSHVDVIRIEKKSIQRENLFS